MHQDFVVVDVVTDFFKKQLDIFFNFELDPATVTDRSIKVVENHSGSVVPISYQTDGNCISISLKEDPVPNVEYMLVCNKEICNITHQHLRTEYVRYIQFTSTIKNVVTWKRSIKYISYGMKRNIMPTIISIGITFK